MQTSAEFGVASAVEPIRDGHFRATIPDGWQQGRGAFGGLVLGTLLRAIRSSQPEVAREVRTLAGDLCGPVKPGAADIHVRVLRRGSHQANVAAELSQDNLLLATATAVLSEARPSPAPVTRLTPPVAEDWRAQELIPIAPPIGPDFAVHYEYRTGGPLPFSGHAEPVCLGWVRERCPPAPLDAPAIIGLLDAWWPTLFSIEQGPRPCATIQFTAELFGIPASLDAQSPLRHRSEMIALREGFFLESRELWHGDTLVALNQQTFAILG
jgi:hypothetical protein